MDEPLSPPPAAAPASESRPETPAKTYPRDVEVRGCFILGALIIGALAFSVTGPIGAFLALLTLLAVFLARGLFAALFSTAATNSGTRPVAVPRRFGVGSLLIVTAAFAMFLGAMQALHVDPIAMGLVAAYVAVVGIGQAVLFGGKAPRRASVLVGILFLLVVGLANMVHAVVTNRPFLGDDIFIEFAGTVFLSIVYGAPFGYIAGTLAAGVFLIIERVWGRLKDDD